MKAPVGNYSNGIGEGFLEVLVVLYFPILLLPVLPFHKTWLKLKEDNEALL